MTKKGKCKHKNKKKVEGARKLKNDFVLST